MNDATIADIRLGWLQRFLSVAKHRNIAKAARECAIDPTALSDSIQRLEEALDRILIIPTTGRLTVMGRSFTSIAEKALALARYSPRNSSKVSAGWLQATIAVAEHGTYVQAAEALSWERYRVMRGVKELEQWIGDKLLYSNGGIKLTDKGQELLPVMLQTIQLLEDSRGPGLRRDKNKPRTLPWWVQSFGPVTPKRGKLSHPIKVVETSVDQHDGCET